VASAPMGVTMGTVVSKLRPAKIRNALSRRWFEARVPRRRYADARLVTLGSAYGGWTIPEGVVRPGWVCYCVGAGGDVSFDLELISRYEAVVRCVDPVPDYIRRALEDASGESAFAAVQAALTATDGPVRMQVTHDPGSESVSPSGLYESDNHVEFPGMTLSTLMEHFGDDHVDLLKLDIEGGEYELLRDLDLAAVGVKVFALQLHHTGGVREAERLIARLEDAGFVPVACKSAVKIAFVRPAALEGADATPEPAGIERQSRAAVRRRAGARRRPVHH
jgi:FkbM family methyltransferase